MNTKRSGNIIFVVCFLFLVPTTLFLMAGLFASTRSIFLRYQFDSQFSSSMSIIFILLLAASYALSSLWWLLFKFRKISFREIPVFLKIGLLCGCILSGLFFLALVFSSFFPQAEGILYFKGSVFLSVVSVFPLLMLVSMLLYIQKRIE